MSQNEVFKNSLYYMVASFLPRIVGIITLYILSISFPEIMAY